VISENKKGRSLDIEHRIMLKLKERYARLKGLAFTNSNASKKVATELDVRRDASSTESHLSKDMDKSGSELLNNYVMPESLDAYHGETSSLVELDAWDGLKIEYQNSVSKDKQIVSSLLMNSEGSGYSFGGVSVKSETGDIGVLKIDHQRDIFARMCRSLYGGLFDVKGVVSTNLLDTSNTMAEVSVEYSSNPKGSIRYKDLTSPPMLLGLKAAFQGTPILSTNFSQMITPSLQVGGEMIYVAANGSSINSLGVKYKIQDTIMAMVATRSPDFQSPNWPRNAPMNNDLKIGLHRSISPRLRLASVLDLNLSKSKNAVSMLRTGYEYTFTRNRVSGYFSTTGDIGTVLEDSSGIAVNLNGNVFKDKWSIGCSMTLQVGGDNDEEDVADTTTLR